MILVVTGCEEMLGESDEAWVEENRLHFEGNDMSFACIVPACFGKPSKQSLEEIFRPMREYSSVNTWNAIMEHAIEHPVRYVEVLGGFQKMLMRIYTFFSERFPSIKNLFFKSNKFAIMYEKLINNFCSAGISEKKAQEAAKKVWGLSR